MSTVQRAEVPVPGGSLAVYRLGAPEPTAPVALAVHGITSTSQAWRAVARRLDGRAALAAVDLRGRGRSAELPGPFGLDAHVRDLVAALDHLGLERPVLAGHSLGAYIVARLARRHPERAAALVLVDGGLTLPIPPGMDREQALEASLAATLARLRMTFPDREAYRSWWAQHPAIASSDVDREDLAAYADHDLVGEPGALRSSVNPEVVRADGVSVFDPADADHLTRPAVLLHAPRGLAGEPPPLLPAEGIRAWEAADCEHRRAAEVADVNHYTITLGHRGSGVVADHLLAALAGGGGPSK